MSRNIVLDTNCLVQIISAHSPYRPAWQAFREGRYILCVSNDILNEYAEILERVANAAVAHNIVNAIARSPYTRMFDPHFRFGLIEQDPDDNTCPSPPSTRIRICSPPTSGCWPVKTAPSTRKTVPWPASSARTTN